MQELFFHADLWAAEAYVTALEAQEPAYLTLLNQGIKIHNWLLDKIKERYPAEVLQAQFGYHEAKQLVHSLNYGVEPAKMAKESRLPLYVAEWVYGFYHNEFPSIRSRQRKIAEQLKTDRTLTSLLGRQRVFFAPIGKDMLNDAYAWPSQSCIGELANIAITKLYWVGRHTEPWMFPALNTHDGMAGRTRVTDLKIEGKTCSFAEIAQVKQRVKDAFNIPITNAGMTVRIPVEIAFGRNFNEQLSKEILRYE